MSLPFNADVSGEVAEAIIAEARGGKWQAKRSNRPEPDMVLKGKNYSMKTEKISGSAKSRLGTREDIITARPDPSASFPKGTTLSNISDDELGQAVLLHYNKEIVRKYEWDIISILLRNKDNTEFIYFEEPADEYDLDAYTWRPTKRAKGENRNIAGYDRKGRLCFKWNSRGKQFYVVHDIPKDADVFKISPRKLKVTDVLALLEATIETPAALEKTEQLLHDSESGQSQG